MHRSEPSDGSPAWHGRCRWNRGGGRMPRGDLSRAPRPTGSEGTNGSRPRGTIDVRIGRRRSDPHPGWRIGRSTCVLRDPAVPPRMPSRQIRPSVRPAGRARIRVARAFAEPTPVPPPHAIPRGPTRRPRARDMAAVATAKRIARETFARGKRIGSEPMRTLHGDAAHKHETKWKRWMQEKGGVSSPWMSVPLGFFAGAFGSVVGVGGGVFLAPALCQACSLPPRVSSGTSLAAVVATGLCAGAHYAKEGCVDATAAVTVATAAVATAPLGAMCTARVKPKALRRILGVFLMGVAPTVPIKRYLQRHSMTEGNVNTESKETCVRAEERAANGIGQAAEDKATTSEGTAGDGPNKAEEHFSLMHSTKGKLASTFSIADHPAEQLAFMASTGALAGFASGLLGVGGGIIVTPCLSLATALPQAAVLGTALVAMVPPSLAALGQHARMGNVRWKVAAGLALGTALGGTAGSRLATRAEDGMLEALFCIGMAAMGWRTFRAAG